MAETTHKRRRFLIDRLQLHLLAITLVYLLITAAVFSIAMFAPLVWQLNVENPTVEQAQVAAEFLSLHARFWPALLVAFAVLSVHSIITSHRIVGPLYRFRTVFGQVRQGNLAPWVGLRRRDFLVKESEALNEMIAGLRDRVDRMVTANREAMKASADVERSLQAESTHEAQVHLVELERALTSQQQQLEAFRLTPE